MPSGVPLVPSGSAPAPMCPAHHYQDAPVVFKCQGSGPGVIYTRVLIEGFRERMDFGIPRSVSHLSFTLTASNFDGDLIIYDPVAGVWLKDHLIQEQSGSWEGSYKGMHVYMQGTNGKPTHEKVVLSGTSIPTPLRMSVQSYGAGTMSLS